MEVVWCRICETNRKLSCIDDRILGCNVCGLVVRTDDVTPEQHPVLVCAQNLGIFDESAVKYAMFCYKKASASGYFRGGEIIAAICLYIGCCTNEVPVMVFDFSMYLRVSVYHVGLLFLDVCMVLSDEVDGFRIVDPVFFIHRFTFALFKENKINFIVVLTALRILADFKSDYVGCWKRLGGLCAAAVYMAANFNGFDVLDVDHVGPAFRGVLSEKLVKRSIKDLAVEFRSVAEEYEYLEYLSGEDMTRNVNALCPHNVEKFCQGFCRVCYDKFLKLSGYFCGGLDVKKCRKCRLTDLENGIVVPREDDDIQVLCGKKRLSSMINFDALCEAFGDDEAQSTNMEFKESKMEQGQDREENRGDELAICGDAHAQGREDSSHKDDQREEVLANKNNPVRGRFGQPKRPWLRRLGLQR